MVEQVADDDIEVLRKQMQSKDAETAAERKARAEVEKALASAKEEAAKAVRERVTADKVALTTALQSVDSTVSSLQKDYAAALEKQDWNSAADINTKISEQQASKTGFKSQLNQITNWEKQQLAAIEAQAERAKTQQQQRTESTDPLDQFKGKTRDWLEKHPEVLNDNKKMSRAQAAHFDALAEGIEFESPEYFARVEEHVNGGKSVSKAAEVIDPGPSDGAVVVDTTEKQEKKAPVMDAGSAAAAPSRPSGSARRAGEGDGRIRLTQSEQDVAARSWPHLSKEEAIVEYAKNKAALIKEGRLPA